MLSLLGMRYNVNTWIASIFYCGLVLAMSSCGSNKPDQQEDRNEPDSVIVVQDTMAEDTLTVNWQGDEKMGMGGFYYKASAYGSYVRPKNQPDKIFIWDGSGNMVGYIPHRGVTYRALSKKWIHITDSTILKNKHFCQQDWHTGLESMELLKAYDIKNDSMVRVFSCIYKHDNLWLNRHDFDTSLVGYISWADYFKKYPIGNEGWEHGYSWIAQTPLYVCPESDNTHGATVFEVDSGHKVEIYLTGEYRGDWARVKIKEAIYHYGPTYFNKAEYLREEEGWIRMVDEKGYPLLREVVLGC